MIEPDSSFRTVPAQGQGWPTTGDQDGEGRGAGQVPRQSLQRHCPKLAFFGLVEAPTNGYGGRAEKAGQARKLKAVN
jgi:hypothetical protein